MGYQQSVLLLVPVIIGAFFVAFVFVTVPSRRSRALRYWSATVVATLACIGACLLPGAGIGFGADWPWALAALGQMLAYGFMLLGIRAYNGRSNTLWFAPAFVLPVGSALVSFTTSEDDLGALLLRGAVLLLFNITIGVECLRGPVRALPSAWLLAIANWGFAAFFAVRIIVGALLFGQVENGLTSPWLMASGAASTLVIVLSVIAVIFLLRGPGARVRLDTPNGVNDAILPAREFARLAETDPSAHARIARIVDFRDVRTALGATRAHQLESALAASVWSAAPADATIGDLRGGQIAALSPALEDASAAMEFDARVREAFEAATAELGLWLPVHLAIESPVGSRAS